MSYQPNLSLHVSDSDSNNSSNSSYLLNPNNKMGSDVNGCGCGGEWWKVLLLLLFLMLLSYYYKVY